MAITRKGTETGLQFGEHSVDVLTTERLVLRAWREEDLEPFAAMNADPRVMEFFPACLTRFESDRLAQSISVTLLQKGWDCSLSNSRPRTPSRVLQDLPFQDSKPPSTHPLRLGGA